MRDVITLPLHLPLSLNAFGGLAVVLALVSVGLIGFILAQIRKRPRVFIPYVFLTAVACDVVVDLTGLTRWEKAAEFFLPVLMLLSAASFAEFYTREVHKSHLWTATSTGIVTISYWLLTAFATGVANV